MAIFTDQFQGIEHFTRRLSQFAPTDGSTGKLFMLNCSSSPLLPRAALMGWEVSGICNDIAWLDEFRSFCESKNLKYGDLIHGDIYNHDCSSIENRYDLLISSGLFIHTPQEVLCRWVKTIVKGGIVFTGIPNCQSVNGKLLQKIDPESWNKLTPHSPESFHKLHLNAGLTPKIEPYYGRGFDINMLVPWSNIKKRCRSPLFFKTLRYTASFASLMISPFVDKKSKKLNSFLYGIYEK
jgi:hypothetical protein